MAYAALLSLTQTLEQILGSRPEEKQIKSLHEKLSFSLSFLDDSSPKNTESMTRMEARIRDAAYEAEDIIELHLSKEILSDGLQKVIKEIDSILVDVEKMIDMNDIDGSSKSSSNNKSAVVGFDNDSMQINIPLSGPPPEFKSTSIDGIENTLVIKSINV
ncbi:uncharacterized protein LOC111375776 [Olea europaea var. sylvestris]|uniref:uncharacterized protein LOC111375776 n=1 Tax=Olea europaea var. sylvestris TaxID=158386 RepID=UPI000C1CDA27|nr:uncharacterized protein LOC111375776 [Olea europaea var. sylvestris]